MSSSSSCKNGRPTASCISRILRRILCFNTLPLSTFDHFKEEERVLIGESGTTPGLVARLMGLDSLPLIGPVEESPTTSAPDSFKTPRSSKRRRIIPPYQELEDENFFILSFERRKSGKNLRKTEDKCKKQSMRRRDCLEEKNKKNKEVNMISNGNLEIGIEGENPRDVLLSLKSSGRKPEKTEDESENSSPNSVLQFVGFTAEQESDSPGEISRLENSKMRRPLSDELESCGDSREGKLMNSGDGVKEENCGEKWDEIGKLAATETMKSSWLRDEMAINRHHFMEISGEIESSVLDQLLKELLIDLEIF